VVEGGTKISGNKKRGLGISQAPFRADSGALEFKQCRLLRFFIGYLLFLLPPPFGPLYFLPSRRAPAIEPFLEPV